MSLYRFCRLAPLVSLVAFVMPGYGRQQSEETVIVTASAYPVPFENLSRSVTVLTRDQIAGLPVASVGEILRYAASIEVRARGPLGVQSDFAIRGAGFGQTLVMVDGVRMNDAQTGHHNGDIPVTLEDIDRIEVLYGPGSSLYGADAFGGTINIITRKKEYRRAASLSAGSHGYWDGAVTAGFMRGGIVQSLSATASGSSGFMADRDFRTIGLTSRTEFGESTRVLFSHMDKAFGAKGFYGPSPSREWTDATLLSLEQQIAGKGENSVTGGFFYRTHGDRFLWDVYRPGLFENRHRTHAIGVRVKAQWSLVEDTQMTVGSEIGGDWIASSNLGHNSFSRSSLFAELQHKLGRTAAFSPGFRFDHYSNFGSAISPSISGSWWVTPSIKARSSLARAFRIPTFTELYYRDPNHQADSALKPERAWGAELGVDWLPTPYWLAKLTVFSRWEKDVIDWVRPSDEQKWNTANIRALQTKGIEIGVQRFLGSGTLLQCGYTYLSSRPDHFSGQSKYVLDYARHSLAAFSSHRIPFGLAAAPSATYKRRIDGRSYWILDGRLTRSFGEFSLYLEASNILDVQYQEIRGVDMPGRWIRVGLKFDSF